MTIFGFILKNTVMISWVSFYACQRWKDCVLEVKDKKGFCPKMGKDDKRQQMIFRNIEILLSQGRVSQ